jgi:hypothetical protein
MAKTFHPFPGKLWKKILVKKPLESGNVIKKCLWQEIHYLMKWEIKLKYAIQLRRSSYFDAL